MSSLSSFPGLKYGSFFGGTSTLSPVFGLRPLRGSRFRRRKLPNPRSSIFSPRWSASMMLLKTVSTMTSECFFVRPESRETSSTSSALVMLPPVMVCLQFLPVPKVIAERCGAVACALLIRLPVGAEFVRLECPDRQANLALGGRELDDLHRVRLPHGELDLPVLPCVLRVVELRHMDQTLDALIKLDERAEVRHAHHLAFDRVAEVVAREEVVPDIRCELLQPEGEPLVLGVDVQHHRLDDVALLQDFGWMLDALAPRHVGDVDQPVDLLLDLDERAELGEVPHLALDL